MDARRLGVSVVNGWEKKRFLQGFLSPLDPDRYLIHSSWILLNPGNEPCFVVRICENGELLPGTFDFGLDFAINPFAYRLESVNVLSRRSAIPCLDLQGRIP